MLDDSVGVGLARIDDRTVAHRCVVSRATIQIHTFGHLGCGVWGARASASGAGAAHGAARTRRHRVYISMFAVFHARCLPDCSLARSPTSPAHHDQSLEPAAHQLDSLKSSKNSPVGQSSMVARMTAFLAPSLGGRGPLWLDMSVSQ